jgi:hypothetical protein
MSSETLLYPSRGVAAVKQLAGSSTAVDHRVVHGIESYQLACLLPHSVRSAACRAPDGSFRMKVGQKFPQRVPQRAFSKEDHSFQALLFD